MILRQAQDDRTISLAQAVELVPFLVELLGQVMALARRIEAAIPREEPAPVIGMAPRADGVSPIRAAEIQADARMRRGMATTMAKDAARHLDERRALAAARAAKRPRAPVANLRPAPFALTPTAVARLVGDATPPIAAGAAVPVEPVKLVDRPRRSEDPRLARANDDQSVSELLPPPGGKIRSDVEKARGDVSRCPPVPEALPHPIVSEPRLGSRAPALLDEAQHCHSPASADEHTEGVGAQSVPVAEAIAAEVFATAERRKVARKFGGGVGNPLPAKVDCQFDDVLVDQHERELRRIDRRPAVRTGESRDRQNAQRVAEQAKAERLETIRAAAARLRQRGVLPS